MTLPPLPVPNVYGFYSYLNMQDYATAAVQAEREACAKVCDTLIRDWPTDTKDAYDAGRLTALRNVADEIRARKD